MPTSKASAESVIQHMLQGKSLKELARRLTVKLPASKPLPAHPARETVLTQDACKRRQELLRRHGASLDYLTGRRPIADPSVFAGHIENYIGLAQVPVGIIGPLRVNGLYAQGDFYVPLATTEGALVASYNRGARVMSQGGGARVMCLMERVTRAPGFSFNNLIEAGTFIVWCVKSFKAFQRVAQATTAHGVLQDMRITVEGNQVYLNLEYTTGDAAGQNIVTIATEAVCRYIAAKTPIKPRRWFVESNMSGDKKATALSYLSVRGKKVTAEALIPRRIFTRFLRTDPETLFEYWKMSFVGGVQSGSLGVQGHYANGLAALFIACGQDAACVSEAAMGITRVNLERGSDLYIAVTLPNLIVGTVGGGTGLPTQRECLAMIGCSGTGTAKKFAEICAAVVLAGEVSIMAALAAGQFAHAHGSYGRPPGRRARAV